jgi:hypothetical protein
MLPRIDELFYQMKGVEMFSNIYLRLGYHQLLVKEEDIPKTMLKTTLGHYEFIVL